MKKNDIKKAFSTLKNAQEKEQFLKDHNIKFTHDSFKLNVPQTYVDPVNVKKSQVYICFGARFEMEAENVRV